MLGLEPRAEMRPDPGAAARFMESCRERGVLVGKCVSKGNAIRIVPSMTVTREDVAETADVFEEALSEIRTPDRG
jgi:4-aminobutyrate aminotransferase-like enzyme